ncbi:MAG: tripartite tricarboxylate transporter substrate binding protein [Cytophagaceae bacterium]|nr:tripartite tricarboxylate transporter substrate binding protein [Gemmatimonadaceae bacterium]
MTNVPGQGGGVAFARVAREMKGNDGVLVAASPSTLLGLAQGHYGTMTERDVRWIAAVATEPSVLAVGPASTWRSFDAFVAAWRANPASVVFGGGSVIGGQDHMKVLLLARAAGVELRNVRYIALSGPYEAIDSLRTGGIHLFPGDMSEVRRFAERNDLRLLALLSDRRATGAFAQVPTARERGIEVTWEVWRGFYAPTEISAMAYDAWVKRLRAMSETAAWKTLLERNGLTPYFSAGREFEQFVQSQTASFRTVSHEIGIDR